MSKPIFCWTCGEHKNHEAFAPDTTQADGLSPECDRCAEMRARAAEMDAQLEHKFDTTIYAIPGQNATRKFRPLAARSAEFLDQQLRARP